MHQQFQNSIYNTKENVEYIVQKLIEDIEHGMEPKQLLFILNKINMSINLAKDLVIVNDKSK